MEHLVLVWFVMLRACGDAGMGDDDLTKRNTLLEFPAACTVPQQRPYPLPYDTTSGCVLEGFLLKRTSGLGGRIIKVWARLKETKLQLCADWNRPEDAKGGATWSDEINLDGVLTSVRPAASRPPTCLPARDGDAAACAGYLG